MAAFPSSIPYGKFKLIAPSVVQRNKVIRGYRRIPRGRVSIDRFDVIWRMEESDYSTFENFYEITINKVDFFDLDIYSGNSMVTQSVRFIEPPIPTDDYPMIIVNARIECIDRIVASSATVDTALGI